MEKITTSIQQLSVQPRVKPNLSYEKICHTVEASGAATVGVCSYLNYKQKKRIQQIEIFKYADQVKQDFIRGEKSLEYASTVFETLGLKKEYLLEKAPTHKFASMSCSMWNFTQNKTSPSVELPLSNFDMTRYQKPENKTVLAVISIGSILLYFTLKIILKKIMKKNNEKPHVN
jgi:hypothetical protein